MNKVTPSEEPIELARKLLAVDAIDPALRARICAAIARQALEDELLSRYGIADARIPRRPLLAFARIHSPDFGARASSAWLHLTWATHHRTDEIDPDLRTIADLVDEVTDLIST
jgi:hypothetical protein